MIKVVFLGTPDFAVESLRKLNEDENISVDLVISQKDKKRSRGKFTPTPVKEYAIENNLTVVPLNYIFDGETYKEGFKGSYDDFFNKLGSTKLFPTTSQPSAGEFYEAYTEAFKEYDEIIVVVLSSKFVALSSCIGSAFN